MAFRYCYLLVRLIYKKWEYRLENLNNYSRFSLQKSRWFQSFQVAKENSRIPSFKFFKIHWTPWNTNIHINITSKDESAEIFKKLEWAPIFSLQGWLPVGIRSSTPVYIEWSRFSTTGLSFKAAYKFAEDVFCKDHETTKPEGEVHVGDSINVGFKLNQYYQQRCTWILVSPTNRSLTIEIESTQSRKFLYNN